MVPSRSFNAASSTFHVLPEIVASVEPIIPRVHPLIGLLRVMLPLSFSMFATRHFPVSCVHSPNPSHCSLPHSVAPLTSMTPTIAPIHPFFFRFSSVGICSPASSSSFRTSSMILCCGRCVLLDPTASALYPTGISFALNSAPLRRLFPHLLSALRRLPSGSKMHHARSGPGIIIAVLASCFFTLRFVCPTPAPCSFLLTSSSFDVGRVALGSSSCCVRTSCCCCCSASVPSFCLACSFLSWSCCISTVTSLTVSSSSHVAASPCPSALGGGCVVLPGVAIILHPRCFGRTSRSSQVRP